MHTHNGYTLRIEREELGNDRIVDAMLVRRACDRWLASRGLLQEGGLNRRRTAEIREAMARKAARQAA